MIPLFLFLGAAVLNILQAVYYYPSLADTAQVHFSINNAAESYANKFTLFLFYCGIVIFVTLMLLLLGTVLPRRAPTMLNIPNGAYWLSEKRAKGTEDYIAAHMFWVGALIMVFLFDMFHQTIVANIERLGKLDHPFLSLGIFILLVIFWYSRFNGHFRKKK
jgi:uncharacterized membrane protein